MTPMRGTVVGIFIAPSAQASMVSVSDARAIPGRGLEGDRYFRADGTFSSKHAPDTELTLIESETLEALARERSIVMTPADSRRNLVTRHVSLSYLVGREFMIGEIRVLGHRLCQPCSHLRRLTRQPDIIDALRQRGGLRAQILTQGTLRVGDPIHPV